MWKSLLGFSNLSIPAATKNTGIDIALVLKSAVNSLVQLTATGAEGQTAWKGQLMMPPLAL